MTNQLNPSPHRTVAHGLPQPSKRYTRAPWTGRNYSPNLGFAAGQRVTCAGVQSAGEIVASVLEGVSVASRTRRRPWPALDQFDIGFVDVGDSGLGTGTVERSIDAGRSPGFFRKKSRTRNPV